MLSKNWNNHNKDIHLIGTSVQVQLLLLVLNWIYLYANGTQFTLPSALDKVSVSALQPKPSESLLIRLP